MPNPLSDPAVAELKNKADAIRKALAELDRALAPKGPASEKAVGPARGTELRSLSKVVDADEVKNAVEALETGFTAFKETLGGIGTQTAVSTTTTTTTTTTEAVERTSSSPNPDVGTSFGEFISSVGRSVAAAQSELDNQARKHLEDPTTGALLLPTLYRIPKLSAEVKFAFGKQDSKGVNLLIFSKKEKSSEEREQSIKFDIVATPPPQELVDRLRAGLPALRLVLESEVRKRVFKAIRNRAKADLPEADQKVLADVLGSNPDTMSTEANRVLILESVPNEGQEYVVVLAATDPKEGASTEIGIWHVNSGDNAKVASALKFTQTNVGKVNQAPLRSLMAALAERQAAVLAVTNPAPSVQS